jgi:GNAT superfamily N-acetyltransferase
MMNHNRVYYPALLESYGLAKVKDLYAWWFTDRHNLVEQWRSRLERIMSRSGVVVRPFREDDFENEVARCQQVYNSAMRDHWGFVKLTDAEFRTFAARLKKITQSHLVLLAEIEGAPVGFSVTVPDINEVIRPLNGRLTTWGLPVGAIRAMRRMRKIATARMLILDVLEGYRRRGVAEALILRTLDYGKNSLHYTGAELSWTLEDNDLINRTIQAVGGQRYKTYRIYEKGLEIRG